MLAWNGDGAAGALSKRDQYATGYTGSSRVPGALAAPTYTAGQSGPVAGTWYYSVGDPATISHDPRAAANGNPQATAGLWQTAAEIQAGSGFAAVTAVRFVSAASLNAGSAVSATIPQTVISGTLNNVYVNRAMIFSATFADQPLLSNEPYVLMPGWTLGNRVWRDNDGDGTFSTGDQPLAGVPIEILDPLGAVVATTTTQSDGRWFVEGLPQGTFRVRIPPSAFAAGMPAAGLQVRTQNANVSAISDEAFDNNNTPTPDPGTTGLVTNPVTFSYLRTNGVITGGGQPLGDNATRLGSPLIPDDFTNMTVDFALAPVPAVSLVKIASGNDLAADATLTYTFLATNTGQTPLTGVTITDTSFSGTGTLSALTCTPTQPATLQPGDVLTCRATYVVTQADVDAGNLDNTAQVVGTPPFDADVTATDDLSIPEPPQSQLTLDKRVAAVADVDGDGRTGAGDTIAWEFDLTNTGNVTLTDLTVNDPLAAAVTCPTDPLPPGATVTCTADNAYPITAADVDAGVVTNTATSAGLDPAGTPVTSNEDTTSTPLDQVPGLALEKRVAAVADVDGDGRTGAGDTIAWEFDLTNTGNVTLTDLTVNDPLAAAVTCPTDPLPPGATVTCTADNAYPITAADVDAGVVTNTATSAGLDPAGTPVTSNEDTTSTPLDQVPGLALEKRVAAVADVDGDGRTGAGDTIAWEFDLTNTGNVTLTDLTVNDPLAAAVTCPTDPLPPGATVTCTADNAYPITAADVDAGVVTNTATSAGLDPAGTPVTSNEDTTSTPLDQVPGLALEKRVAAVADVDGDGRTGAGDTIAWEFDLTNTGNVTLTDLTVNDPLLDSAGISVSCPADALPAGDVITCTSAAPYVITSADADAGAVVNSAGATSIDPADKPIESNEATTQTSTWPTPDTTQPPTTTPNEPAGNLPNTGAPILDTLQAGIGLICIGTAMVLGARLRRHRRRA